MRTSHQFGGAPAVTTATRLFPALVVLATLAAMIFLLDTPKTEASGTAGPVVSTAKNKLGRILVDSRGRTLYLFGKDRSGRSACTGKCATFWPPLIASGTPRAAGGPRRL
jgi:predicted lipoprotein with Yx(FWY)xxD motif